jgi:hypothetical protein
MPKKKAAKSRLIPEDLLESLTPDVERLIAESGKVNDFRYLRDRPYYHALVYYVMFSHLLDDMRKKLGGIDDGTAMANAYFWYRVVTDWSSRIEPGSSPLEDEMEYVEGAPGHYFDDDEYVAILDAADAYVTRGRRSGAASKSAANRKRRATGRKTSARRKAQ